MAIQLSKKEIIILGFGIVAQIFAIGIFYFIRRKPWNGTELKIEQA